jgi:hypothetical protein
MQLTSAWTFASVKRIHPRSSQARRETFALLTKTYHGSRVTGH